MKIQLKLKILALLTAIMPSFTIFGKDYRIESPDGKLSAEITTSPDLKISVNSGNRVVILPSSIGLITENGSVVGNNPKVSKIKRYNVSSEIQSPFYRATSIPDNYNELSFNIGKDWRVEFRCYNDGVAYRFVSLGKKPLKIVDEVADYRFPDSSFACVPYVRPRSKSVESFEQQYFNSFENIYTESPLSELNSKRLIMLPAIVEPAEGVKVCFTESDLENYPGMFLNYAGENNLKGVWAPVVKEQHQGGHNNLQMIVDSRENYIASVDSPRSFPWRIAVVTENDSELAATNLTYLLSSPSRVTDISWIKPGKVAWDWWNDWNIDGVDFKSGVNNPTYKAYIDFASKNGIEYVILDEGWAVNKKADLFQVVPEIDLPELIAYAKERNVGLILWAGYHAFNRDMEKVCRHYSDMGIKGFKVDFMDRDDQEIIDFNRRAAETAAKYNLILDLHGTSKPAGLNRTYPNVLNFEAVNGLEQMKWSRDTLDQVKYDVMIPFTRQVAGPMDYTQGAMLNASKGNYRPCNTEPMSQGTRCRQLALYVIFDSPFNMLCDSPSNYMREPESLEFIAGIPTVWDETRILDAKMGEYIVTARRKGSKWYIGGITDWTPREMELDLSFLPEGVKEAVLFTDGANAHRKGRDYKRSLINIDPSKPFKVKLAPGGGFTLTI